METTIPVLIGLASVVLLCMGAILDDRRARVRRRAQREELEAALPLLHSINADRCIGCEACIDVCPTEVLDLVEHKVRVARFSDCVQCEQCANACPTQALVMYREGTTPRMLTVPEIDEHFQTGVPGQYLIGEVAGKPLVKNAANLGRAVIEHISRDLAHKPAAARHTADVLDVVIVGSGPGGLSAGLSCIKHKLSCLVLEKEHIISSTVSRYPKGKHFMAEPCTSQNVSYLPVFDGTKEELVAAWTQVVEGAKLPIRLGEAVETVQRGDDGVFTIKSTVGSYRARTVVLATGLRGKPRLLAVPGANLEKVQSLLDDPAEFAGEAVLVVGGGDSAVEGAMALADVGATVTLSYRGDGFKRCKQGNQKRLAELIASQRLTVLLESNVKCFTPDRVTITLADRSEATIANQRAFVLIGADTPVAWLESNHVRFVERPHLYTLGSTEDVVRRLAPDAAECPRTPEAALAIVLDRPAPRSGRRVRSVVEHLRGEFREVVTSVSAAFRLSDLEARAPRRAVTRTPMRGARAMRANSHVIPASRLTAGPDQTTVGPAPIRPRSAPRRAGTNVGNETLRGLPTLGRDITTDAVPSLRTLEHAAGLQGREHQAQQIAAPRRAHEAKTEEVVSLRAVEPSTDAAVPSPGELDQPTIAEPHPWADDDEATFAVPRPRVPRNASDVASSHQTDHTETDHTVVERRVSTVETSAIRPPPPRARPPALPVRPSAPPAPPSVPPARSSAPATRPPALPARPSAALARPSAPLVRPSAPPPPPPPRSGRLARGSEGYATPPAVPVAPQRPHVTGPDRQRGDLAGRARLGR